MKNKILTAFHKLILLGVVIAGALIASIFAFWHPGSGHHTPKIPDLLKKENDYYRYDVLAGHIHRTNAERVFPWEEHKKGEITMRTNNLGFREDEPTLEEKGAGVTRILVAGDSHIDGVIYNNESFPNQLESLLNKAQGNNTYECINGGVGCYGPQNYSGFLKRFLYLKPDVFLLVVYTGNDFIDAISQEQFRGRYKTPPRPKGYGEKLQALFKKNRGVLGQAFNQIYFFKTFPELMEKAIEITMYQIDIIQQICKEKNIKLLVLMLPTKIDVEIHTDEDRIMDALKILNVSQDVLSINRGLTKMFAAELSKRKINYIDLYEQMMDKDVELYWKKDYHLNDAGHKLVAEIVLTHFSPDNLVN